MTEQEPKPENAETLEQRLINELRENGPEDPETRELLVKWTKEQEEIAKAFEDFSLGVIIMNLKRGGLYLKSGFPEEAFENFDDALLQAQNENRVNLSREIEKNMNEIYQKFQ